MAETQAGNTIKFAVGTFAVTKALDYLGHHVKTQVKERAGRHTQKLSRKTKIIFGVGVVIALGATWYYYRKKKLELQAAAAAAQKQPVVVGVEDVIASAIPAVDVSIW